MKVNKIVHVPQLWLWLKSYPLPDSLEYKIFDVGYAGVECKIYRKGEYSWLKAFWNDPSIAVVYSDEIKLYDPAYFSDIEDLLKDYEKETGVQTTLTFWENS